MTAPLAAMRLVALQMVRVGLNDPTVFQKQQPCFFRRHAGNESLGCVECSA